MRVGNPNDGGYIIPIDILDQVDVIYSYGINDDVSFEDGVLEHRDIPIHLYDHTIDSLPHEHPSFHFHKEGITHTPSSSSVLPMDTFGHHLERNGDQGKRILLKMDIESCEWDVIPTLEPYMKDILCITLEIHWLHDKRHHEKYLKALSLLREKYSLFHIHGNNCAGTFGPKKIPQVLELTYISKSLVKE